MLVSYTFEIPQTLKSKLERIAESEHRSLAAQIRLIIDEYVKENKKR